MARQPGRQEPADPPTAAFAVHATEPAPGTLLDDRYRLVRRLSRERWAAIDELLDRSVDIRFVAVSPEQVLAGSGAERDARWLRLLDAGEHAGRTWVAVEDPCRPSLAQRVREGPLDPDAAVEVTRQVCAALLDTPAPPRLDADRVFLDADGVRLDGFAGFDNPAKPDPVRDVGGILFVALTAAPPNEIAPRRIRGGVPRALDRITAEALTGGIGSLSELEQALRALPRRRTAAVTAQRGRAARRVATWLLPPAALAVLGLLAWTLGSDLGAVPGADLVNPTLHRLGHPAGNTSRLVWSHPPTATSVDPQGDGTEDPAGAPLAVDGNPTTAWHTDVYRSPQFGGLKSGVGLMLQLPGRPPVGRASILLTAPGATLQLRAGNHPPAGTRLPPVQAQVTARGTRVNLRLAHPVRARYWLVWLTRLPPAGGGYAEGIAEIRLDRPGG